VWGRKLEPGKVFAARSGCHQGEVSRRSKNRECNLENLKPSSTLRLFGVPSNGRLTYSPSHRVLGPYANTVPNTGGDINIYYIKGDPYRSVPGPITSSLSRTHACPSCQLRNACTTLCTIYHHAIGTIYDVTRRRHLGCWQF
ncbi:Hypothetical predicted protein, partial [Pelobates cultripes]